jgi:hypothetical protein
LVFLLCNNESVCTFECADRVNFVPKINSVSVYCVVYYILLLTAKNFFLQIVLIGVNVGSIRPTQITSDIICYGMWRRCKALSRDHSSFCPVGTIGKADETTHLHPVSKARIRGTFSCLYFYKGKWDETI